ncbi:MAG: LytTR family DNA-binding domain-containing protein [Pseudomonadota bacterium]
MNSTVWRHVVDRWVFVAQSPKFLAVFTAFVLIGAVFGPFGISEGMTIAERLKLSIVLNVISWSIGVLVVVPTRMWLFSNGYSHRKSIIFSSTLANLLILPSLIWTLESWLGRTVDLAQIFEQFLALAALITVIPLFMAPRPEPTLLSTESSKLLVLTEKENLIADELAANPILLKINPSKRGTLWALVAQDHYVEVITELGNELVFMRFGDAIEQCEDGTGIRCHRSSWVSKSGLKDTQRKKNRRLIVTLPNGREIPVSRSREKQVLNFSGETLAV